MLFLTWLTKAKSPKENVWNPKGQSSIFKCFPIPTWEETWIQSHFWVLTEPLPDTWELKMTKKCSYKKAGGGVATKQHIWWWFRGTAFQVIAVIANWPSLCTDFECHPKQNCVFLSFIHTANLEGYNSAWDGTVGVFVEVCVSASNAEGSFQHLIWTTLPWPGCPRLAQSH